MIECIDQTGRKIVMQNYASAIVSLVPSQTELLFDLELNEEVTGITKFCVHPQEWFKMKTKVGGTKNIDVEKIKALKPDLIVANKEENVREQIEELEKYFPVYVSDVNTIDDALKMIDDIGLMTNKSQNAKVIIKKIKDAFSQLSAACPQLSVLYFIWRNPYMTVGGETFIAEMLRCCGFQNVCENEKRYPEITVSQLSSVSCQVVLLSSEPYPFNEKHIAEFKIMLPSAKILLVDGEMFSWYGSRLIKAVDYFKRLINEVRK